VGEETLAALLAAGRRVRAYCPIGDLVAGMAYLVRRLLENTSNDSFLRAQAEGVDLTTLLEKP
jgi:RHH-type proline utilization regulon transcriptional repressor/proline dehydrogenase/delta 1-pyrroline-5-carboxylate dehydrogenase